MRIFKPRVKNFQTSCQVITGQEYDEETGLYNFRARLYDDDLFRFYAIDPAGEGFTPYAFVGNSPLMYIDPTGKFIIETLIGIGISAAIGGAVSGATYLAMSYAYNQPITGLGFLKAFGIGALGGAISGGISSLGGVFGNQFAFGTLGRVGSYAATSVINESPITLNGLIGLGVSGGLAGFMPAFSGFDGGNPVSNIIGEGIYDATVGGVSSGVGMGVESMLSGGNFWDGFEKGFGAGAIGGGVNAALKNITFGYIEPPDPERNKSAINGLNEMDREFESVGEGLGNHRQIFRSGGAASLVHKLFGSPGFAYGGQHMWAKSELNPGDENRNFLHEGFHLYQNNKRGYAHFLGRGFLEQFFNRQNAYKTPGNMEWAAEQAKWRYYK